MPLSYQLANQSDAHVRVHGGLWNAQPSSLGHCPNSSARGPLIAHSSSSLAISLISIDRTRWTALSRLAFKSSHCLCNRSTLVSSSSTSTLAIFSSSVLRTHNVFDCPPYVLVFLGLPAIL